MSRRIEPVQLSGPAGRLEATCTLPSGALRGAALVCHPHPQHGGTMHTKAVYHAARGLENAGLAVLRFNFRGVGRSAGVYDNGVGERDDARAALAWLRAQWPDTPLLVGGFSFGSWVGLEVGCESAATTALLGIGVPVVLYDFSFLERDRRPILLVAGDQDVFCPADAFRALAANLGGRCESVLLPGAEHLLTTHLEALESAVTRFATAQLAANPGL